MAGVVSVASVVISNSAMATGASWFSLCADAGAAKEHSAPHSTPTTSFEILRKVSQFLFDNTRRGQHAFSHKRTDHLSILSTGQRLTAICDSGRELQTPSPRGVDVELGLDAGKPALTRYPDKPPTATVPTRSPTSRATRRGQERMRSPE